MFDFSSITDQAVQKRREQLGGLLPVKKTALRAADRLWEQKRGAVVVKKDRHAERQVTAGNPFDLFPTPIELAERLVGELDYLGGVWGEPSAGTGRIAGAMRAAGKQPVCVEYAYNATELLRTRGYNVRCEDIMGVHDLRFDVVVMNPPFSRQQDIDHVLHVWGLLQPGGRLIAIMSAGTLTRNTKKAQAFRAWYDEHGDRYPEVLPAGTFKDTKVSAIIIRANK